MLGRTDCNNMIACGPGCMEEGFMSLRAKVEGLRKERKNGCDDGLKGFNAGDQSTESSGSDPQCRNKFQVVELLYLRKRCAARRGHLRLGWVRCTRDRNRVADGAGCVPGCRTPHRPWHNERAHPRKYGGGHPGLAKEGQTRPPIRRWCLSLVVQGDGQGLQREATRSHNSGRDQSGMRQTTSGWFWRPQRGPRVSSHNRLTRFPY